MFFLLKYFLHWILGFPGGTVLNNLPVNARDTRRRLNSWVGKITWRRKWQTAPVFLPGKLHGQRSLAGYSPWGGKELDMTEWLSTFPIREEKMKAYIYLFILAFISFLTEYSCFIMCWFQMYSKMIRLYTHTYTYICIHISFSDYFTL